MSDKKKYSPEEVEQIVISKIASAFSQTIDAVLANRQEGLRALLLQEGWETHDIGGIMDSLRVSLLEKFNLGYESTPSSFPSNRLLIPSDAKTPDSIIGDFQEALRQIGRIKTPTAGHFRQ